MPTCPNCHNDFKARKDEACPGCGTPVSIYKGRWYRTDDGAPTMAILKHFERLVSQKQAQARGIPVVFKVPPKGHRYKLELVFAARLLDEAGGELDLVRSTLDTLFFDRDFNFKTRTSLVGIQKDYTLALSIVQAQEAAKKLADKIKQKSFDMVMDREDIFS